MRIGIIFNSFVGYGGAQTCVAVLIEALNKIGITPNIISEQEVNYNLYPEKNLKFEFEQVNYSISSTFYYNYFKYLSPFYEFVFFFKLSWLKEQYDFLYVLEPNVVIDSNVQNLKYLHFSPIARGYISNSANSSYKYYLYHYFIKFFMPVFDFKKSKTVINSKFSLSFLKNNFYFEAPVIYPPCFKSLLTQNFVKKPNSVLFFSRISPNKRPEIILELAKSFKNINFIIAGSATGGDGEYSNSLNSKVDELKLHNLSIIPNPTSIEISTLFSDAEYFIFCAPKEHFGIVTVEAINYGCLPLVHNSGGQKEIVEDEFLRFDDSNLHEKFEAIISLSKEQKISLLKGLKSHISIFSDESYQNKMLNYLKSE